MKFKENHNYTYFKYVILLIIPFERMNFALAKIHFCFSGFLFVVQNKILLHNYLPHKKINLFRKRHKISEEFDNE